MPNSVTSTAIAAIHLLGVVSIMSFKILNTENLYDLNEELNYFAKCHYHKGGQEAHKLIKQMWDESKEHPREGSTEGVLRDEGWDKAFKLILNMLHTRFVP